jgi:hypothetical protein
MNNIRSFEVLTVVMKSTAFCDTTPSRLVDRYQHYRQMCCAHLQNQLSKRVPIKCCPINKATWCHIPYSTVFKAVLAIMLLTCTWQWYNSNFGCDFKAFHDFPQSMQENSTSEPQLHHGQFNSNSSLTTSKMPYWDTKQKHARKKNVTEWQSLIFCKYVYIGPKAAFEGGKWDDRHRPCSWGGPALQA